MTTEKKASHLFVWVNILACVMLLTFPFLMTPHNESMTFSRYLGFVGGILTYLAIFYLNYLWLIERYLSKRKWLPFFLVNFVIILGLCTLLFGWHNYYMAHIAQDVPPMGRPHGPSFYLFFCIRNAVFMVFSASLAVAIRMTLQWQRTEREKVSMQAAASQAELKNLKSQLNPHFLFNTLNNIYALTRVDPDKAQEALLHLSKTLRYVLYDNNQERVPLEKELSFTRNYIDLMSLRLAANVRLNVSLPSDTEVAGWSVAPLVFIMLVENAFKHGISPSAPSFIDIELVIEKPILRFTVKNSYFPKEAGDLSGSGIGQDNLRRRLELLYQGKASYNAGVEEEVYKAKLILPLE